MIASRMQTLYPGRRVLSGDGGFGALLTARAKQPRIAVVA